MNIQSTLRVLSIAVTVIGSLLLFALLTPVVHAQPSTEWEIHDMNRPNPPVVDPGPGLIQDQRAPIPSDAIVLFDGANTSAWTHNDGRPVEWTLKDGYMQVNPGTGSIQTKQGFGDVQLYVEWASPSPPFNTGQDRGNSGIFLMGMYEIQVLDSYLSDTYADGQAASVYGQYPPLVNASRPPGYWQSYMIVFRRPRFDTQGAVTEPAHVTVLHNGVLVQDHVALSGPTGHHARPPYEAHADRLPLGLQDHNEPVRYRTVWVRDLEAE